MLGIGDALTLASKVDGLILVTRLKRLRRPMVTDLGRALTRCQAKPLGLVITGASTEDTYGYVYGYTYGRTETEPWLDGEQRRVRSPDQSESRS